MSFSIDYEVTAPVFNIQSYSIHDGPGIRTTVFVKGCPLRCIWCANPESNAAYPELMTYSSKCTGCGSCVPACPKGAISVQPREGKYIAVTDRTKCVNCGACVSVCPNDAREIAGKEMTVREVIDKVKGDKLFFDGSGGGMTISGGEALAHPKFSANLFAAAHAEGIHTAIESCSFAAREVVDLVLPHVDLALLDVKHMDSAAHEKLVGVPNDGQRRPRKAGWRAQRIHSGEHPPYPRRPPRTGDPADAHHPRLQRQHRKPPRRRPLRRQPGP